MPKTAQQSVLDEHQDDMHWTLRQALGILPHASRQAFFWIQRNQNIKSRLRLK
jgi:hypothetical protein